MSVKDNILMGSYGTELSARAAVFGGTFNTLIGVIFLAIVVLSPNGLMGIWERLFQAGTLDRWRRTPPASGP